MKEKEFIHFETAIVNLTNVAVIKEAKTKNEETTVEIISSSSELLGEIVLPKGKKLKDYSLIPAT